MKLTEDKIINAVNEYIDTDLKPLMSSMAALEQFTFGFGLGIFRRKMQTALRRLLSSKVASTLELVDEDGSVDVETAYLAATDSLKTVGSVELAGVRFTTSDLDKLYSIMCRYG
jgi:hypothetical protein